jgi:hypothetical protein
LQTQHSTSKHRYNVLISKIRIDYPPVKNNLFIAFLCVEWHFKSLKPRIVYRRYGYFPWIALNMVMLKPPCHLWSILWTNLISWGTSQLCEHANLLFDCVRPIVHCLPDKRFARSQTCKGFVNMATY